MDKSKTALYRHYNADGGLLYVGVSFSATYRYTKHLGTSDWAHSSVKMTIEWFDSREEAFAAESLAIANEKPEFNIRGVGEPKTERKKTGKKVVYGFSLDQADRDALLQLCPAKYGMNAANFMRVVVDAILDDRIVIEKPEGKSGVYE